ncbi:MAG: PaaI family thioesterase [Bryobacteraceae bacterium]
MAFEHDLGLRVVRKHKDGVTVELTLRPELLNSNGVLHGGITASVVDEAAWYAIRYHFDDQRPATTAELKINYLLPIAGKKLTARAYLLRAGKQLCVSRVDVLDEKRRLAAAAIVTYMLLATTRPPPLQ